ncbi:MAG: Gldg family protein [bacterium]
MNFENKNGKAKTIFFEKILNIIAIILIATISLYLLEKNPIVFDLTRNKRYTVDKQIIDLLNKLDENVYVKVFYDKSNQEYNKISEVLRNLSRYSKRVKYSFLDPRRDVVKAQLYGFTSSNQVLIMYKDRKKFENTLDNEKFANVVSNLLRQKQGKILFTTGHKESSIDDYNQEGLSSLSKYLKDEGLTVEVVNLAVDDIDKSIALFIIGPKIDFSSQEIEKIKNYLYDGGKVLIALKNYDKNKFKNLDGLISSYGIDVSQSFIIGLDPSNVALAIANVVNVPYLSALSNVNFYMLNPMVIRRNEEVKDVSLSEVLVSKGVEVTKEMIRSNRILVSKDSIKDYTVGMMAEKIIKDKKANLLVLGDYAMFSNVLVNAGENVNFLLAIVDYFVGNDSGFVFKSKDVPDIPILIPAYQQLILYFTYVLIPIVFFLSTMFFIYRRKVLRR